MFQILICRCVRTIPQSRIRSTAPFTQGSFTSKVENEAVVSFTLSVKDFTATKRTNIHQQSSLV